MECEPEALGCLLMQEKPQRGTRTLKSWSDVVNKGFLIFKSWLKDINVHGEDQNLTEREANQLVKDFTAERAHNEVEFYMGMITDDQQTFNGPSQPPEKCLSVGSDHE